MRRFLIMAVVLGVGGALLWYFEAERRRDGSRGDDVRVVERRESTIDSGPIDPANDPAFEADLDGSEQRGSDGAEGSDDDDRNRRYPGERGVFGGEVSYDLNAREDGGPRVLITAEDTRPMDEIGSRYELIKVEISSFEVDGSPRRDEPQRSRIQADTAVVDAQMDELGLADFDEEVAARLYGVVVEQFRGTPLAPLKLRAPRLDAFFVTEELRSVDDDLVRFLSRDIRGSGRGLIALTQPSRLTFGDGADVSIALGGGREARITTTSSGALRIDDVTPTEGRDESGPRLVRVQAEDGVQVLLQSSTELDEDDERRGPTTIDAASIDVVLELFEGSERPLVRSARADGAVTIRQGRERYTGDTARIFFEGGTPVRAVLEEDPRLVYIIREPDGTELELEVTGDGPVTAYFTGTAEAGDEPADDGRLRFVFAGPGRIEAPDRGGVVTFGNEARGLGLEDRSEATVFLSGGVRVRAREGTLDSESLVVTYRAEEVMRFAAEGPTRIVTTPADEGEAYRATAGGGLVARLVEDSWYVESAEDFHAESLGSDPHRLDARTVRDLDITARTLEATGDIRYQSLWGEVTSAEALVRASDRLELYGTEDAPVVLDLVPEGERMRGETLALAGVRAGSVRAVELTLEESAFRAVGRVAAEFETAEGVWAFDADVLRAEREAVDAETPLRIEANMVREMRYDSDVGVAVLAADRIVADGVVLEAKGDDDSESGVDSESDVTVRMLGRARVLLESFGPGPQPVIARWAIESDTAVFTRGPLVPGPRPLAPFELAADGVSQCSYEAGGRDARLSAERVEIDALLGADGLPLESAEGDSDLVGSSLVATGRVDLTYRNEPSETPLNAKGSRFVLIDGERGRLDEERGQRVRATGAFPGDLQPFTLTAKSLAFTPTEVRADGPELDFSPPIRLRQLGNVEIRSLKADSFVADERQLVLRGGDGGRVIGTGVPTPTGTPRFEADSLTIDREDLERPQRTLGPFEPVPPQEELGGDDRGSVGEGIDWDLGDGRVVRADVFSMLNDVMRLEGTTEPAHIEFYGTSFDAESIEVDQKRFLLQAGRGAVRGEGDATRPPWTLEFAEITSRELEDEILITIAAPIVTAGADTARADYVAIFLDRARWQAKGASLLRKEPMPDSFPVDEVAAAAREQPNFLAELLFDLQSEEYGEYLRAVYIEGSFEVSRADRRAATGSKAYIDLARAVAWMQDVELVYPLRTSGEEVPLRVRTDRLATDEEGRLVAQGATLTTCDHEEPHFVVRTSEFALVPRGDGRWNFGARGNRIRFQGGWTLPLPSIGNVVLDEEFGIEGFENEAGEVTPLKDIGVAQTARFGAVIGAAFRFDVGKIGTWLGERLGMNTSAVRGKWDTEAQYLWDRGPLLGLGLQLRERKPGDDPDEDFRLDGFLSGIPDDGEDRGAVRVPTDERDSLRLYGWIRSRYPIVRGEWVDVAFASQTDAGIQSEFYEPEFQRFDQRDTFVRWRKALGADYLTIGVQARVDDFRSQREELPSFLAYRGERSVGELAGTPILWGGRFEAGYFRRREGEPGRDLYSDLPGGAQLGIGNNEAARADLVQRVSMPISTDVAAIRATPFAEFRGTAWSDSLEGTEDPIRGAAITGLELSTTLHKVTDNGYLHALSPRASISTDVWFEEDGATPIPFDRTEEPIDGTTFDAGLRGLWQRPGTFETLDLDVRTIFRSDRANGLEDTSELAILGRYITRYGSGEGLIGLSHDARYDLSDDQTVYSRSTFAIRPNDSFLVEFGYSQARGIDDLELFETAGATSRLTLDPKWEIEFGYLHDLQNDQQLQTQVVLRRFSHDFVLDIGFQDRAGEGGINFGINFSPLLGWRRARFGMLDR